MIRLCGPLWGLNELRMVLAPGDAEKRLESFLQRAFASPEYGFVPLKNARVGLYLCLRACGVGAGSRVAVNAMCCSSVTLAIEALNARPVYIDTEPGNFCLSADGLAQALSLGGIRAVIAAHFVGQRSDMPRLAAICRDRGVPLIDDAAYQAGLRMGPSWAGASGQFGVWSFNNKLLSGPEGAIVIARGECLDRLREQVAGLPQPQMPLREGVKLYGRNALRRLFGSRIPGCMSGQAAPANWRVPTPVRLADPPDWRASPRQCAIMLAQLRRVETIVGRVTASAAMYRRLLHGTVYTVGDLPYDGAFGRTIPVYWEADANAGDSPSDHADRTLRIRRHLYSQGIQTLFYVPPWWWEGAQAAASLPHCGGLWCRTLFVPNHPLLSASDIARVCRCLIDAWDVSRLPDPCRVHGKTPVEMCSGVAS